MGSDAATSVTNADARFHSVANAYAIGPALQPTVGSPNPMLPNVALSRRLADHLVPVAPAVEEGPRSLFNGVDLRGWEMAGPGTFVVCEGALQAHPGTDIGLLWCTTPTPPDFVLRCEWRCSAADDNSGVFVRFPCVHTMGFANPAYVAVQFGFEVQIDKAGSPDGLDLHRTGAIYGESDQASHLRPALPPGQWNTYEIQVQDQTYVVFLNGAQVTRFDNHHPGRGEPSKPNAPSFIGLQTHTGHVAFRNIQLRSALTTPTPGWRRLRSARRGARRAHGAGRRRQSYAHPRALPGRHGRLGAPRRSAVRSSPPRQSPVTNVDRLGRRS